MLIENCPLLEIHLHGTEVGGVHVDRCFLAFKDLQCLRIEAYFSGLVLLLLFPVMVSQIW